VPSVVGIDLAAGRGVTAVAVLEVDADAGALPRFDLTRNQTVQSDEEVVDAAVSAQPAVIAIDAPLTLPAAVAAALRTSPHSAAAEQVQSTKERSPYTRAAERDPLWGRLGLHPLPVSFLGGLTFRAIALVPQLRTRLPHASIIEVFPSATLRLLGIRPSEPGGGRRAAKTSSAARSATQAGLCIHIAGLLHPETKLLGADLLDALASALTATYHLRGATLAVGDPAEGQIILPRHTAAAPL